MVINQCKGCPFNNYDFDSCELAYFLEDESIVYTPVRGVHASCPLRKGAITFVLEEEN